jgi:hypothetical protein
MKKTNRQPDWPLWGRDPIRYTFAGILIVGLVLNWFFCIEPAKYLVKTGAGYGVILFGYMAIRSLVRWIKSKRETHNKALESV